ncbi:MAG: tRNA (N(6)-L-threonylcarbamoyladenosine(37)-C(2))-methylthiotransferase MtaB [Clostridia bacterium]|nr:tRNA (N(6)-L-threonylcarbamoyladenosine(37)-C(2))-methylthiotransferase MtaB [Clostridia bacterium]
MQTVALHTLGCKVSQYETEAVRERFIDMGFTPVAFGEAADVYVINTCTVTAESDRKCRQMIRRARAASPEAIVAVMGCYSQRSPEDAERVGADIVLGTMDKLSVVDRAMEMLALKGASNRSKALVSVAPLTRAEFEPMRITEAPRTRAYIKIEDGCESKCTYCAIKEARGPVRSKLPEDVIGEVEGLAKSGIREVVLTGIETGSYGRDLNTGYGLGDLIRELGERGAVERIRLGSLAPELCGEDFAAAARACPAITPHFHISMQSGSDRVLARMKRRYTRARAIENINRLKEYIPGARFTTDLMVGFPGETEEDFLDTVSLVKEVGFIACHVFAYSRRAGTPAASYPDQIPEGVKRERSERLIEVAREVREGILSEVVEEGGALRCILETYSDGAYTAHSDEFFECRIEAPEGLEGEYVSCLPTSHKDGVILAKLM